MYFRYTKIKKINNIENLAYKKEKRKETVSILSRHFTYLKQDKSVSYTVILCKEIKISYLD